MNMINFLIYFTAPILIIYLVGLLTSSILNADFNPTLFTFALVIYLLADNAMAKSKISRGD